MTVAVGSRLGSYEVTSAIGAGGMGEVYRARDTRLKRDVAIKVLPDAFAHDPDRLARFQREAEMLATLNHPNIAAIFGLETTDALTGIVLELVEGDTLAAVIARGPVAVADALPIARQIADALEAAHERGIVHRDLKPANIKVRLDGTVKVLDFGLAKALDQSSPGAIVDQAASSTLTSPATAPGVIMGTVAYMPPEQARGHAIDRRADVWAFGVVLYEMLTGTQAFPGETVSDTLAAVLKSDPDWTRLPAATPPSVRRLVERCLERDPRQRLQAIGEARIVLSAPRDQHEDVPARRPRRRVVGASVLATALAVASLAAAWIGTRPSPQGPHAIRKFDVMLDGLETGLDSTPAVSPDGERIVYRAGGRLWVRALSEFTPKPLPGSAGGIYAFWSPDSRQVAFVSNGRVWRVGVDGPEATPVGSVPSDLSGTGGGVWTVGGDLVLAGSDRVGLFAVPLSGTGGREILSLERTQESDFHDVSELPQGRGFLFTIHRRQGPDTIAMVADGKRVTVLQIAGETLRSPVYSPAGYLVYAREVLNPGVWAIRFSLSRLATEGDPVLLVPGGAAPTIASDGTLAFLRSPDLPAQVVSIDRRGAVEQLDELPGQPMRAPPPFWTLTASPDRQHITVTLKIASGADLFSYDRVRRITTRLTVGAAVAMNPTWSSDGRRVFFTSFGGSTAGNVFVVSAHEPGAGERVLPPSDVWRWPCTVSPDGRWLVYAEGLDSSTDLWAASLDGSAAPHRLTSTPSFRELDAKFSPDGGWIAYTSNSSGRPEIYIRTFADAESIQISTGGATMPSWSADGREIFYRTTAAMMSVKLAKTPSGLQPAPPQQLFPISDPQLLNSYAVTPDGQRFLLVRSAGTDRVSVFMNWAAHVDDLARSR